MAKNNYIKRHRRVRENHLLNIKEEYQLFTIFGSVFTCFKKLPVTEQLATREKEFFFLKKQ